MEIFGGNDVVDYFARDIPNDNDVLKRWSHISSQTTYVKQHKHVDFVPCNVIYHHQFIIESSTSLYSNRKTILRNDDGNWKMTFNYEGTITWGLSTEIKIDGCVLKNDSRNFGSALWTFDYWNGPTKDYWTHT